MNYRKILITGGAGFVGSNLAISFKQHYSDLEVVALDNLKRRGSELNLPRLKSAGVKYVHGDVRHKSDLIDIGDTELLIECSAEPSVLAGLDGQTDYLIDTNLNGLINCLEYIRRSHGDIVFLSTSRVYPYDLLSTANYLEEATRFTFKDQQILPGLSAKGISESFPLIGAKSIYGATKLASELFIREYAESFGIKSIVNRFGCIAGPWQMGKVDQGVMALWLLRHIFNKELSYIGFGGHGKQVRDFIHINDVFEIIDKQINNIDALNTSTFNIGGGLKNSISLTELTQLCQQVTGNKISIKSDPVDRPADLKSYISDNTSIEQTLKWTPKKSILDIVNDTYGWISDNKSLLENIV